MITLYEHMKGIIIYEIKNKTTFSVIIVSYFDF